ncbi:MAG: peptide ABC transporter ATP-binding protein [Gammaproteobacteria bacterium]|nr:peptide ABC transporter ATP-binding protein [Gammaproteobacteria bacterium]|tara:strand:- start:3460 stop:4455 length:996 start_codon:yes stop_codon:yes gene_type:complete
MHSVLRVEDLSVSFELEAGLVNVVDRINFSVEAGETVGLVGESGCGKSVTALSVMGLLPRPAGRVVGGKVLLGDIDLLTLPADKRQAIRGDRISMIFQEPMTALNPVQRIGRQLGESFRLHQPELDSNAITKQCVSLMDRVGIPAPDERLSAYPHELSGGMRQRIMIAMALATRPDVLIADEPTTALDVTIQAQILELLRELQSDYGMSVIFITHDLGVIAELCTNVVVMYAGRIAERASVGDLFREPHHPYTRGLLDSIPRMDTIPKSLLTTIEGAVPSIGELPTGCRFNNRCNFSDSLCQQSEPEMRNIGADHESACHHIERFKAELIA